MKKICIISGLIAWLVCFVTLPICATDWTSQNVTMEVGETKTLYLPSSITGKSLKSVAFYSASYQVVEVTSHTNYSVTVKALKPTSTAVIVRCDYNYYINNGGFMYLGSGAHDFKITVNRETTIKPTKIELPNVFSVEVGETRDIVPNVIPSNAEYKLTWSISDSSIASIGYKGNTVMITGKSEGYADLKVKADNGVYTTCRISVYKPIPTSISLESELKLESGKTKQLNASITPVNSNYTLRWTISDSSIASVSQTGLVTAIKPGIAFVTVKTNNGCTATCKVTVTETKKTITISDKEMPTEIPSKANVKYERQFYKGWNSVCVPFEFTREMMDNQKKGVKIATFKRAEVFGQQRKVALEYVEKVNAGQPCFIYTPSEFFCNINIEDATLVNEPDNKGPLKGNFTKIIIGEGLYKLSKDGASISVTTDENATSMPYRAYLDLK